MEKSRIDSIYLQPKHSLVHNGYPRRPYFSRQFDAILTELNGPKFLPCFWPHYTPLLRPTPQVTTATTASGQGLPIMVTSSLH